MNSLFNPTVGELLKDWPGVAIFTRRDVAVLASQPRPVPAPVRPSEPAQRAR